MNIYETKVAIYVRLSKEDIRPGEEESESIQNQKSMLINYAAKCQWVVYNIYCDDDYSGVYSGDENMRPEFNHLINDAQKNKFDVVLCKSQSRFSRNMEVIEKYIHCDFVKWGIRFVGLIDNADTDVKGNKKARQINGLINEWFVEDLSDNIRAVFKDKMRKGEFLASFAPYGYLKDPLDKHHLVINPKTAPIVKQIYLWHAQGYGASKICRMLNDRRIPNPRKQQEIDGLRKTFMYKPHEIGIWTTTTIGDILNNQVYCGDVVQHTFEKVSYKSKKVKKVPQDKHIISYDMHEPIISREDFAETKKRLSEKSKSCGIGTPHILSGLVYCHYCGKAMTKNHSISIKEGVQRHIGYLRCRDKYSYSRKSQCLTPNIRIDEIIQAVQFELIEMFKEETVNSVKSENILKKLQDKKNDTMVYQMEFANLNAEIEKTNMALSRLYDDRLNGVISVDQYVSYNKQYSEKLDILKEKRNVVELKMSEVCEYDYSNIAESIQAFLNSRNIDRKILKTLIKRIEFGEINLETNKPILKIFWSWE